jgi:hypothetical protein
MKKNERLFGNIRALEAMKEELIDNLKTVNANYKSNTNLVTTRANDGV